MLSLDKIVMIPKPAMLITSSLWTLFQVWCNVEEDPEEIKAQILWGVHPPAQVRWVNSK